MRNVLKLCGTMLFGKYLMRIGMEVSVPLQYYCSCLPVGCIHPATHEETVISEENVV